MINAFDQQIVRGKKILDNLNLIDKKVDQIINKPELNMVYRENELLKNSTFRFTQSEEQAVNKLDHLLFDDIVHSRKVYQKLEGVEDYLMKVKSEKDSCEEKLKTEINEKLRVKQAMAEMEINYRVQKAKLKR
jgi:hypothetical protein